MVWNTKAIMLDFLVTLLLAILIFVPACLSTSKIFSFDQSKQNFPDFVDDLRKVSVAPTGERRTTILILNEGTAVTYFEPHQDQIRVDVDANCAGCSDYFFTLEKPTSCKDPDKGCLCLFQENTFDVESDSFHVLPEKTICDDVSYALRLPVCGFGKANGVNSYTCYNGFVIERNLADEASWRVDAYYELPRRIPLQIKKEGDVIFLTG